MAEPSAPDDLDDRIARARSGRAPAAGPRPQPKGYAQGSRVLAELIGAPLGGALLGWALDRWFGTFPVLMLVLLVLATVAAFRNIYRIGQEPAK